MNRRKSLFKMPRTLSIRIKKYKSHNCKNCKSKRIGGDKMNPFACCVWCDLCSPIHLQSEFSCWTSGNNEVDEFIRFQQIKTKKSCDLIEWIPYDRFSN